MTALVVAALLAGSPSPDPVDAIIKDIDALYCDLHQTPELSNQETKTAAKMAARFKALGFSVTEKVGGTGVVAVLENGPGPTVLMRADMDALPVEEKTNVPYASRNKGVMHACGHDLHLSMLVGALTVLTKDRRSWSGTIVAIAQPAEEKGEGAKAMIKDGLFTRFPKPDYALALHDSGILPSTKVGVVPGFMLANVDSVDITVHGRGGHGAAPHLTVDPIVIAARIVTTLQTLVARENRPFEPAVVTVGSFHAGTKHNIIPEEAKLQLTVRSYKAEVRERLLAGIERIAKAEAIAGNAPKPPEVKVTESLDATWNDPRLAERLRAAMIKQMGADAVTDGERVMGAEDFGEMHRAGIPSMILWVGAADPKKWEEAKDKSQASPPTHSPYFIPDKDRSLRTGIKAWLAMAKELMPAKDQGRSP